MRRSRGRAPAAATGTRAPTWCSAPAARSPSREAAAAAYGGGRLSSREECGAWLLGEVPRCIGGDRSVDGVGEFSRAHVALGEEYQILLHGGVARRIQQGVPGLRRVFAELVGLGENLAVERCGAWRNARLDAGRRRDLTERGVLRRVPLQQVLEE